MDSQSGRESQVDASPTMHLPNNTQRQHLNHIRELRIFKSVVETPEVYMMNLRSTRQPQSIKALVTQRLVQSIESDIYKKHFSNSLNTADIGFPRNLVVSSNK
jgi:hypothetical protein